jgi:hypothetical protein
MHDSREYGHAVVVNGGAEPALATAGAIVEFDGAALFLCGAGALGDLVTNNDFETAVAAGNPVAVIFSNPEEAFELRGRLSKFARDGAVATLQRPSNS